MAKIRLDALILSDKNGNPKRMTKTKKFFDSKAELEKHRAAATAKTNLKVEYLFTEIIN